MEIQTITFGANSLQQTFLIPGKYLEIIESAYPISVQFFDKNGNAVADQGLVNAESGLFVDLRTEGGWGALLITSSVPQQIRLLIGNAIGGSRRQPGIVQVVDGGRARTIAGLAFQAVIQAQAVTAGNRPQGQLWNPVGSQRQIVVKAMTLSSSVSMFVSVSHSANPFTTLAGNTVSKLAPNTAGVGQLRRQETNGLAGAGSLHGSSLQSNGQIAIRFEEPVVLVPGSGIVFQSDIVVTGPQINVNAVFDLLEEIL
jgi:hypothetical protein